jgi:hypothetical protein
MFSLMFSTQVVSVGCGDALAPIVCDEDSCRCMGRNFCDLECLEGERTNCGQGLFTCGIDCP